MLVEYNMIRMKEWGRRWMETIIAWGFGGVEVLDGRHTQLGIISIPMFIDVFGTGINVS